MLGRVNAISAETDTNKISQVGGYSLTNVVTLCVQVGKTRKPTIVELEGIGPGVETSLAVEVKGVVGGRGELESWNQAGVFVVLVGPVVREVRGLSGSCLSTPG